MGTSEKHQRFCWSSSENFAGVDHPALIPVIPKILMEFYQPEVQKYWRRIGCGDLGGDLG